MVPLKYWFAFLCNFCFGLILVLAQETASPQLLLSREEFLEGRILFAEITLLQRDIKDRQDKVQLLCNQAIRKRNLEQTKYDCRWYADLGRIEPLLEKK